MDCFVASLPCANASRLSQAMTEDRESRVTSLLLAAVHQAVVEADQCAGLADDAVARRVVLAPCVRAVIAIGAAAVAAVSVRATVIGVGATAAVIGGGGRSEI